MLGMVDAPLYIFSFDTGQICWSNEAARTFWNAQSAEELHSRELGPHGPAHRVRLAEYRVALHRGEQRRELWTFYPAGQPTPMMVTCSGVLVDGHGEGMLVELQVQESATLSDNDRRLTEMFHSMPAMISLFSDKGELLLRNPAATSCFDALDKSLAPGDDALQAAFADPARFRSMMDQLRSAGFSVGRAVMAVSGAPVHGLELRRVNDPVSGEPAILVTQTELLALAHLGEPSGEFDDIARLGMITAPVIVATLGEGRIVSNNAAAQQRLGKAGEVGRLARDMFADPRQYDALRDAIMTSGAGSLPCYLNDFTAKKFWASVSGGRVSSEEGGAIVLLISDIDSLYRQASSLKEALDLERRINEIQRRFLAIAAHDFRTPLAHIDSAAQRIMRRSAELSPAELADRAGQIRAAVKRLLGLLEGTLGRARNPVPLIGLELSHGRLDDLIRAIVAIHRDISPDARIDLRLVEIPEMDFDHIMMEQVVGNILSNAVKYAKGQPHIEIDGLVRDGEFVIRFRDWGIGIPPGDRETIFEDYSRAGNVGTIPGTGLGLSIARQIVELHGGSLRLIEVDGPGAAFEMTLPLPLPS